MEAVILLGKLCIGGKVLQDFLTNRTQYIRHSKFNKIQEQFPPF